MGEKEQSIVVKNDEVRNEMLQKNIGKYSQYKDSLSHAIGDTYYVKETPSNSIMGDKSLLEYTHDGKSEYSYNIEKQYLNFKEAKKESTVGEIIRDGYNKVKEVENEFVYQVLNPPKTEIIRMGGYGNYITYVSETYGKELETLRFIEGLLARNDVKYQMALSEVGIVEPYVSQALAGVITTNINNFSGEDTALGKLTNQLYAETLYYGATFNSSRKRDRDTKESTMWGAEAFNTENTHVYPYLTPSLFDAYGNNLRNVYNLKNMFTIDSNTGRIREDFKAAVIDDERNWKSLTELGYSKRYTELDIFSGNTWGNGMENIQSPYAEVSLDEKTGRYNVNFSDDGSTISSQDVDYYANNEWDDINQTLDSNSLLAKSIGYFQANAKLRHGRNLPYRNSNENPRNFYYGHKYEKFEDCIRGGQNRFTQKELGENLEKVGLRRKGGSEYLQSNSVLQTNNLVRITPKFNSKSEDIKKCMFSIENLAWKDVLLDKALPKGQIGPNGGRIMWFPPYGLDFNETVTPEWNTESFIGRGEKIFTYKDTQRSANLNFILLIDHPSVLNATKKYRDSDNDKDILRFFAGYEDFEVGKEEKTIIENTYNKQIEGNESEATTENGEKCVFYIYFPNMYSGHRYNSGIVDQDMFEYLLGGRDAYYNASMEATNMIGYEMENVGISTSDSASTENCIESIDGKWFRYRIDAGNHKLNNEENYKDSSGNQLNGRVTETESTCSFADFYYAAYSGESGKETILNYVKNFVNEDRVAELKSIFENINDSSVIDIEGGSTSQDEKNSHALAKKRAEGVQDLLMELFPDSKYNNLVYIVGEDLNKTDSTNTNQAKRQRYVKVTITYNTPKINEEGSSVIKEISDSIQLQEVKLAANGYDEYSEDKEYLVNEYEYFTELPKTDKFYYDKIKDKITHFDPAYHSISPEGFNARLTFLQQCTRQGHTIESKGNGSSGETANNLAFGRMPVCVLRIGDFINTRMIITSLNIQYSENGIVWDINPEGAGVQPMYAKVSMNVNLIGGQTLEGPISRLQNAVSFNYYANTGVYDGRSDRASTDANGKVTYENLWLPNNNEQ